jgi:hypothetical protein
MQILYYEIISHGESKKDKTCDVKLYGFVENGQR